MDVDDAIKLRKSNRSFLDKSVPDHLLESLVDIAHYAPSWMNKQCWHFIIIKDKDIIEQIARSNITNRWLKQAPVLIFACADPHLSGKREGLSYFLVDASIALDHLILSATSKGLGTCWIGSFNEEKIKQLLGVPPRIRIVSFTPIGYVTEKDSMNNLIRSKIVRSTKRKSLSEIIHWNHW